MPKERNKEDKRGETVAEVEEERVSEEKDQEGSVDHREDKDNEDGSSAEGSGTLSGNGAVVLDKSVKTFIALLAQEWERESRPVHELYALLQGMGYVIQPPQLKSWRAHVEECGAAEFESRGRGPGRLLSDVQLDVLLGWCISATESGKMLTLGEGVSFCKEAFRVNVSKMTMSNIFRSKGLASRRFQGRRSTFVIPDSKGEAAKKAREAYEEFKKTGKVGGEELATPNKRRRREDAAEEEEEEEGAVRSPTKNRKRARRSADVADDNEVDVVDRARNEELLVDEGIDNRRMGTEQEVETGEDTLQKLIPDSYQLLFGGKIDTADDDDDDNVVRVLRK